MKSFAVSFLAGSLFHAYGWTYVAAWFKNVKVGATAYFLKLFT